MDEVKLREHVPFPSRTWERAREARCIPLQSILDAELPRIHIPRTSFPFSPSMFYRTLVILFLSVVAVFAVDKYAPLADFAGIYPTYSTVVSLGLLQSLAPDAKIIEAKEGDNIAAFLCVWPEVTVKIRVDPEMGPALIRSRK